MSSLRYANYDIELAAAREFLRGCERLPYDTFNATHVFGTCRMGSDARHSVVDKDCRSHRWRNLFIVDASVFPSSGGESPSLTIEALAIRAGAHIRNLLAQREL